MTTTLKDLEQEISETEERLERLRKELHEKQNQSEEVQLAELLHSEFCKHNHTDGCDWMYHKWSDLSIGHARKKYHNHALTLLRQDYTIEDVTKILEEYRNLKPR